MELLAQNKAAEAERFFFQALAVNERQKGPGHILTVASVVDCSRVLQYQVWKNSFFSEILTVMSIRC